MDAVIVISPQGNGLVVSQVVIHDDGISVWTAGPHGPQPSRRTYRSLAEAVEQNSRSTTTAIKVSVADVEEARGLLGKPPPQA